MASEQIDELIEQANLSADSGNWLAAYQKLVQAQRFQPEHPGLLNGLGVCLLQLGRAEEAVACFEKLVSLLPDSPEALHSLGLAYVAMDDLKHAETAYRKALAIDPAFRLAQKSLAVVCVKQEEHVREGLDILLSLVEEDPEDIEAVLILAATFEEGGQHSSAIQLYEYVLNLQPENEVAQRAIAKLSSLEQSDGKQPFLPKVSSADGTMPKVEDIGLRISMARDKKVVFYAGFEFATAARLMIVAQALQHNGLSVKYVSDVDSQDISSSDTFIFSRPHLKQEWVDAFQACMRAGKRIIVDIDEDFHNLPATHPGFNIVGQGHPRALEIFEKMLNVADVVTVSSSILADRYKTYTRRVEVIPNGWSKDNAQWDRPAPKHRTFNVGWIDLPTERGNLMLLKGEVTKFIREHRKALLVVGGDIEAVKIFDELSEERVLYLPFTSFDDYPYVLSQFDVFLCPVKRTPYGYARSDVRVMEAGIRRIPWVASKIPAYQEWGVGGIFVDRNGGWYRILKQLYEDSSLRQKLGEEGRLKAETRESAEIAKMWKSLVV
ncbi:MAG: tetratricopeptide repeat protein [Anaerolineae bacterium]|nr:tetratricopeptide repeat protein [Anaerolineae bacterium]